MSLTRALLLAGGVVAAAAGCSSVPNVPPSGSVVPSEGKVQVASSLSYTYEELIAAPAVAWSLKGILDNSLDQLPILRTPLVLYFVYQPFAPNWSVEEAQLDGETYYVRLLAKRFRVGGDGEAMNVLKRRAVQLQYERGYAGYRIVDYSEGIESSTPVAQRYSHGIVQLVRAETAPGRR
ncbi:hypothetical protein [Azospira restricta]|uniref:Lipoprotein n=1 Tax=Azospira restricta TaxID=404405 RepID=A0A974SRZ7_9RHOO|nr:hypothetical protein [Azospira restricta]QRJ65461.1 hypothetical protein IWH25_09105 [Azospira restricta]